MTVHSETLKKFKSNILIETGTYLGETSRKCIEELGYSKVYTIELQEHLYKQCKINLKKHIKSGQIVLLNGNSSDKLKEILDEINEPVTILLDAHIDGGNYIQGVTPEIEWCPLYRELEIISNHQTKEHCILIDDVRIIGNIGWGTEVALDVLIDKLKQINPNYSISYGKGEIDDDVLIAHLNIK